MIAVLLLVGCTEPGPSTDLDDGSATSPETGTTAVTGDTGTEPVDPCLVPAVTLGDGLKLHTPLAPLDPVVMNHGPQGGWHVDVSALVIGTGQIVGLHPNLFHDGAPLTATGAPATVLALAPATPCGFTFFGQRAVFELAGAPDPLAAICALEGEILSLTMSVEDISNGLVLEAQIDVTAELDATDVSPCGSL